MPIAGASILVGCTEGRDPQILGRRVEGGAGGSWTGREILLYLIMYRKYAWKWWLLKGYRVICPEVAVNGQFLAEKSKKFKLPEKIEIFQKFAWKKLEFLENLPEKIEIFRKFAWKKSKFCCEIAWKNRNFSEICLKNRNLFWPGSKTPKFQTRLTPLQYSMHLYLCA